MFASLLILLVLPLTDLSHIRGNEFKPFSRISFWFLVALFIVLMKIGGRHAENPYIGIGQVATALYFSYFIILVPGITLLENTLTDLNLTDHGAAHVALKNNKILTIPRLVLSYNIIIFYLIYLIIYLTIILNIYNSNFDSNILDDESLTNNTARSAEYNYISKKKVNHYNYYLPCESNNLNTNEIQALPSELNTDTSAEVQQEMMEDAQEVMVELIDNLEDSSTRKEAELNFNLLVQNQLDGEEVTKVSYLPYESIQFIADVVADLPEGSVAQEVATEIVNNNPEFAAVKEALKDKT